MQVRGVLAQYLVFSFDAAVPAVKTLFYCSVPNVCVGYTNRQIANNRLQEKVGGSVKLKDFYSSFSQRQSCKTEMIQKRGSTNYTML